MTVVFHCDGDACKATAKAGTVTSGMPRGWTVKYVYKKGELTASGTRHLCVDCHGVTKDEAPAKPASQPVRRRRPRKTKTKETTKSTDQADLF